MHVNGSSDILPILATSKSDKNESPTLAPNDAAEVAPHATPTKRPARTFKFASKDADASNKKTVALVPQNTLPADKDNIPSKGTTRTNCQGNAIHLAAFPPKDVSVTTAENNVTDSAAPVSKAGALVCTDEVAVKDRKIAELSAVLAATNAEMAERALATDALLTKITKAASDIIATLGDDIQEERHFLQIQYDALVRKSYGEEHTDSDHRMDEHRLLLAHGGTISNTNGHARGAFQNAAGLVIKWCFGVAAAIVCFVFASCVLVAVGPWTVELVQSVLPCMQ